MPYAQATGAKIYYEEAGSGEPIVFAHEFAGDYRTWEPQMRWFSRYYRCISYNARGYPPSDVPSDDASYGQTHATDDIAAVMKHLGLARAHIVGLSMGAFATLHFGLRYPALARSLVVAGCGTGAPKAVRERFQAECEAGAKRFLAVGAQGMAPDYGISPTRVQLQNKDTRGWEEFVRNLSEHSGLGSALTLRNYQGRRPSLYDLEAELEALRVPTLLVVGDEDEPCLDTTLWLKRKIKSAGMWMAPRTGHVVNLEEPALFNEMIGEFFRAVEHGRWGLRDPRSLTGAMIAGGLKPER